MSALHPRIVCSATPPVSEPRRRLRSVCCYCHKTINDDVGEAPRLALDCHPEGGDRELVSHGICPECFERFHPQWQGQDLSEYLERFPAPVVVVDAQRRVLALNSAVRAMLSRPPMLADSPLAGEALECAHAALPGGCGGTVHCKTCAVRLAVERCIQDGVDSIGVPASLTRSDGPIELRVSARRLGKAVQVTLEPA